MKHFERLVTKRTLVGLIGMGMLLYISIHNGTDTSMAIASIAMAVSGAAVGDAVMSRGKNKEE